MHVGLPKTGTTYLQDALWANRDALRERGVLLPGRRRLHLLASLEVREDSGLVNRPGGIEHPWQDLVADARAWSGDVLITHEFFGAATTEQARRAVEDFPGWEVHVVVTARALVDLFLSRWQEWIKNGARGTIDDYPPERPGARAASGEWGWQSFDLAIVLDRWGAVVPHERVHVLPMAPRRSDPEELWVRFLGVLGIDPAGFELPQSAANTSLGLVEVELLRRVAEHLGDFRSAHDRGRWIRGYLGEGDILPRSREKFRPGPEKLAELEQRGQRAQEMLRNGGYDLVGDLSLLESSDVSGRRHPGEVSDGEMLASATVAIANLMRDVREARAGTTTLPAPRAKFRIWRRFRVSVSERIRRRA